jgi:hypothetical protein
MVAVTIDIPGGTERQYEQIVATVFPEGKIPEGWVVHLAGPTENGWRVVNVVPSQEQFDAFAREQLLPAAQAAGGRNARGRVLSRPPHDPELRQLRCLIRCTATPSSSPPSRSSD